MAGAMAGAAGAGKRAPRLPVLIRVKAPRDGRMQERRVILTFELYLDMDGGEPQFCALTCDDGDVPQEARAALEEARAMSVEVRRDGRTVLTLAMTG